MLIHWMNFRRLDNLWALHWPLAAVAGGCVVASLTLVAVYRRIIRRPHSVSTVFLALGLACTAIVGAVVAVGRGTTDPPAITAAEKLKPLPGRSAAPPLLFIGLDGASWRVLQSEVDNGSAPTLRRLMGGGTHGTMDALWPPYWSGAAWAAILTGLPRETTGVYEDLAATAPGVPPFQVPITNSFLLNPMYSVRSLLVGTGVIQFVLHPRSMLNGKPVWEWLYDAGVDTAIVRFRFTHPPKGRATVAISDRVGYDGWERLGVRRDPVADAVTPSVHADALLAPFRAERPANRALFDQLLPPRDRIRPSDSLRDPIDALQGAADIDDRTFDAGERIVMNNPTQAFLGIYIAGLDGVEHAFWPYRFPGDYVENRPLAADVARLRDVLPRYVRFLDRRLGQLLARYQEPPNVVIVSDHGHGATTLSTDWRGWHTKDAIVLASGPSVPRQATPIHVSYYDIVPTVLALQGFDRPSMVEGRSFRTVNASRESKRQGCHNRYPCPPRVGAWLSLVERSVWDRDVAGSNPVAPTIHSTCFSTRPARWSRAATTQHTIAHAAPRHHPARTSVGQCLPR